ncbi:MAG: 30S ribosomal protein S4 [Candidatus Marinimicrobia bacterium]|nr:30S ribosomal protein S4 [Candidatus Neomarinimicrobiota bacterium]
MSRYTGPACKQCRREGLKLMLKGQRCQQAKCASDRGRPLPGGQPKRRPKTSDYGMQLREKQRLKRMYGLSEAQFHLFFDRAARTRGLTGEQLLQMLELRLDNIVYRLGFADSRRAARQFVNHGHVQVNGRKASIPSMVLGVGDVIEVRTRDASQGYAKGAEDRAESRERVGWLLFDAATLRGEVLHVPSRDEIGPIVNEQMIVELYSK